MRDEHHHHHHEKKGNKKYKLCRFDFEIKKKIKLLEAVSL